MVGLMEAADSAEAVARASRWVSLNYVRHAIVLAAWLAALRAFSLVYRQEARREWAGGVAAAEPAAM
jgi:hypothetical protein